MFVSLSKIELKYLIILILMKLFYVDVFRAFGIFLL